MPSPLPRQDRWNGFAHYGSIDFGLPQITVGSAPALSVSWPAQRSLTLQPADSPSRLMRPSTPEAPAALLPPPPLRLLPGGAIQFPGGFISRCGPAPFHGALLSRDYEHLPIRNIPLISTARGTPLILVEFGCYGYPKACEIDWESSSSFPADTACRASIHFGAASRSSSGRFIVKAATTVSCRSHHTLKLLLEKSPR